MSSSALQPSASVPGRRHRRLRALWPAVCIAAVAVVFAGYVLLVASNVVYLGWHDIRWFFTRSRMWVRFWLTVRTATTATTSWGPFR